ncbi:MAG: hypothetical protein AAGF12_33075 [Myxococcota bacterium]
MAHFLRDHTILMVTGDDAGSWLNGQVTCDLKLASPRAAAYGLFVTVKGKVISDVWVLPRGEEFWLVVPRSQTARLLERFDQQIIMEDAEVEELEGRAIVTLQGTEPGPSWDPLGTTYLADRLGLGGFDLVFESSKTAAVKAALDAQGVREADDEQWAAAHVIHQRPRFGVDFDERHYPQEAGLKDLAVSFNKGCYLGQEVICTLESRGKLSKRLVALRAGPDATVPAGTEIEVEGTPVGIVTSAASSTDGLAALAYLRSKHADAPVVRAGQTELEVVGAVG